MKLCRGGIPPSADGGLLCPRWLVVAKSACLRFRLTAKTAPASLLLLFPANPLRWASPGATMDWAKRRRGRLKMGTPCPYSPFPGPRLRGRSPDRCCNISGAQNLSDSPQFNPGPLGPCVCKNFRFCHSTTAPEFAEPTITVRRRPRRNHQSPKFPFQGPLHRENAPNQGKRLNGHYHNTDHADGLDATPERQRRRQQGG